MDLHKFTHIFHFKVPVTNNLFNFFVQFINNFWVLAEKVYGPCQHLRKTKKKKI